MLFALLPDEIIREKIIPYTYLPQKYELLEEIKTFNLKPKLITITQQGEMIYSRFYKKLYFRN